MTTDTMDQAALWAAVEAGDYGCLPILADTYEEEGGLGGMIAAQIRTFVARDGDPLAAGWAEGGDAQARHWLGRWIALAARPKTAEQIAAIEMAASEVSWLRSQDDILDWADRVGQDAWVIDGDERPDAGASLLTTGSVYLWWNSRGTPGRYVHLWVEPSPEGLRLQLEWDTGTCRRSTFLGWPDRAALDSYEDFGPLHHERISDVVLDGFSTPQGGAE